MTNVVDLNSVRQSNKSKPNDPAEVAQPAPVEENRLLEVNSLNMFVQLIVLWHQKKVAELNHFLTIPDEGNISIIISEKGKDDQEIIMSGEALKGFKAGLQTALTALGRLPFGVTYEEPVQGAEAPALTDASATADNNVEPQQPV